MLRRFLRAALRRSPTAFLVALFVLVAATSAAAYTLLPEPPVPATESATVKVFPSNGHGSGVHIGDGFIVTAAHVVGQEKTVQVKGKNGPTRKADVLWVNTAHDIALLRTSSDGLGAARLACRAVKAGDPIVSYGNPLKIEFVAAYGKIAGEPREAGPWKSVYVTDITTVMGQSGGPVYADGGDLIGITVGVMAAPIGASGSLVGYGFVVPSTAVCELMGRVG
ncbi:trypsin-like peptidase domain-containing protein [Agrobacterium tumefaciens]|uniref:S1 family peptidase n=1 Tax=Agrobacterium tumefaciens TaxID=358 RepID=UPI001573AD75|nr:serine protease [Agrobacterium tumefaciens]NTA48123.1 trypsin-like peptidase domain-containing protein [Agrobacterium tumefaciens]